MKEASFYEKRDGKTIHCFLCRHNCVIAYGKRGLCGVRENRDGTLYSLVWGLPCAYHVDPIEKKPLFLLLSRPEGLPQWPRMQLPLPPLPEP